MKTQAKRTTDGGLGHIEPAHTGTGHDDMTSSPQIIKAESSSTYTGRPPSFCIILPMYNEAANAESCIRAIAKHLGEIPARTGIIAVDDGSSDGTGEELQRLRPSISGLTVETHRQNAGYGGACRTGFTAALRDGFDYALVMDADGTQLPKYISSFLEPMGRHVDFIKATRYAGDGGVDGVPLRRRLVSKAGNVLARVALQLPLTDYTNGFRAIRAPLLARMTSTERGFAVLIEEVRLARRLGANFGEVPYRLTVRKSVDSESKFNYSWRTYWSYLKYVFRP